MTNMVWLYGGRESLVIYGIVMFLCMIIAYLTFKRSHSKTKGDLKDE